MKTIKFGTKRTEAPAIVVGCMRLADKTADEMNAMIHFCMENGANFFDHADIYAGGESERLFGAAMKDDPSLKREDLLIQSKCRNPER